MKKSRSKSNFLKSTIASTAVVTCSVATYGQNPPTEPAFLISGELQTQMIDSASEYARPLLRQVLQRPLNELTSAEKTFVSGILFDEVIRGDQQLVEALEANPDNHETLEELAPYAAMSFEVGK